jgi:metabolite-proton symporter
MTPGSPSDRRKMRRVAFASGVGTVIEFYDFSVYGTAAALVFSKAFFPSLGAAAASVVALATFGVAFVIRPLGAIVFGHFGDRIGRKNTLVWTLLIMGLATVTIGLLPSAATIGAAAPVCLIILRCVQGLAMGGEWAGASLMTAETAPVDQRGKYGMAPQLGPSLGFVLSSLTFLAISLTLTPDDFVSWGWRIPFLASAVLILVGLIVRVSLEETPAFAAEGSRAKRSPRLPVTELVTQQGRELALATGGTVAVFALFYIAVAYLPSYATATLHLPQSTVLIVGAGGGVVVAITTILSAVWSDRAGRRKVLLIGNTVGLLGAVVLFPALSGGTVVSLVIGVAVLQAGVGLAYGPLAAYLPELFATRYRYTGSGLAYNLATVLGAALTPLISDVLIRQFGVLAVTLYLVVICVITLACLAASPETADSGAVTSRRAFVESPVQN